MLEPMEESELCVQVAEELWLFLPARDRRGRLRVAYDGSSSLGHVVQSIGVPLTEVGELLIDGRPVEHGHRPAAGDVVDVRAVRRPQRVTDVPLRFLLDVHLGTLARRLRLVGLDVAYDNDRDDDSLIEQANAERRVLLTQDRGLLRRRTLWLGAHVRGSRPDDQFGDVLERFAPPLAPWTRCTACNGLLVRVGKDDVDVELEPGTRRSFDAFARCAACAQVYWRGAHHRQLQEFVATAREIVTATG